MSKKIYLISDTFFGRKNIIDIAKRKEFDSIESMNEELISRWNETVSEYDIVYHLGNFAWDPITATAVLKRLNGSIIFVKGNYDDALEESLTNQGTAICYDGQILELPEYNAVLCHYPLEDWNGKDRGSVHFHGHTLKDLSTDLSKMNRVNVCVDCWNYAPICIDTILEIIKDYKQLSEQEK